MSSYTKGYRAEHDFADYLQRSGWREATRSEQGLHVDPGDIAGTPFVWEIRSRKEPRINSWVAELAGLKASQRTIYGFVIIKPQGIGTPERWVAATPLMDLAYLGSVARRPLTNMADAAYTAATPLLAARLAKPNTLCVYAKGADPVGLMQVAQLIDLLHLAGFGVNTRDNASAA